MGTILVLVFATATVQNADELLRTAYDKYTKGDVEGAYQDYNRAVGLAPQDPQAWHGRGITKRDRGDVDGSIEDFSKAFQLDPKMGEAVGNRGFSLRLKGEFDAALADFNRALQLNPTLNIVYVGRGIVKRDKGDPKGALADFDRALKADPKNIEAITYRGNLHFCQGVLLEALKDFRKILELKRGPTEYAQLQIWLIQARTGERMRGTRDLESHLKNRKKEEWSDKVARFLVGQLSEAEFLKAAESADGKADRIQRCDAWYYAGARRQIEGDVEKSREYYQKCVETGVRESLEYDSARAALK
jgi:lipoprotein NlpI